MKNKISSYSALAVAASILPIACKKDESKMASDIESHEINLTIIRPDLSHIPSIGYETIDLDGNGVYDFRLFTEVDQRSYGSLLYRTVVYSISPGNEFLTDKQTTYDGYYYFCTPKHEGDKIDSNSTDFKPFAFFSYERELSDVGINGEGEQYLGFRFKIGPATHYGWARVYVSERHDTLIFKEYAFEKNPDTEIIVGEK